MAVRGKTVADAMELIGLLSTRFDVHLERQDKLNDATYEEITKLKIEGIRQDAKIDMVKNDTVRILETMTKSRNNFKDWFVAATPWLFAIFTLIYFYIKNGGL